MNKEELRHNLDTLHKKYEADRKNILREFAYSNNPYQIGDIFIDHIGGVKIESIGISIDYVTGNAISSCIYKGIELKKDGTPMKKQTGRIAYQSNDINPSPIN